jgi:GntR family transcriptional regulator
MLKSKRPLLYMQVASQIMNDIRTGIFNDALPREEELRMMYDVSRSTIRSALHELRNDGVIYTLHGKGTFIARQTDNLIRLDKFKGFYQIIEDSGYTPSIENLSLTEASDLEPAYDLPEWFFKEKVFVLERLLHAEAVPAVYLREYIPRRLLKGDTLDPSATSIYSLAKSQVDRDIAYTISEISAVMPTSKIEKLFKMAAPAPLVMLKERHFDQFNEVLIYSEAYLNTLESLRLGILRRD